MERPTFLVFNDIFNELFTEKLTLTKKLHFKGCKLKTENETVFLVFALAYITSVNSDLLSEGR